MPYTPDALQSFAFKKGMVATVHHVGEMTIAHIAQSIQKQVPAVPVPTFTVDMGNGPSEQPNPADPAYQRAVAERNGQINIKVMDALIEYAVDIQIDQAWLARTKFGLAQIGTPIDEISDKVAFVKHCCVGSATELRALGDLIRGDIEEATAAAVETFPRDVPGPAPEPVEPAAIGSTVQPGL